MAGDLTGIDNVGEFFSQHYLSELLEKDLAEQGEGIAAAVEQTQKALVALGRDLFRLLGESRLLPSPAAASGQSPRIRDARVKALYDLGREFQVRLAETLGFTYQSGAFFALDDGRAAPALHVVERHEEPYLVVFEGRFRGEDESLLDIPWIAPLPAAAYGEGLKAPAREDTLGDIIGAAFAQEKPPRWVLLVAGAEIILAERPRWGRGQYLRFDLAELCGRKDASALRITAALLGKKSLVPDGGALLHDSLDEKSHKHAQGVSADLKYAAREAVELIANEWVHYQRTVAKKALHGERVARELTEECLVYLYRLLVLFYVEARAGELGLLPMDSPEYALGYSLEALRDLEQANLGPEARGGFFFDESLRMLFKLVNDGYAGPGQLPLASAMAREGMDERGFLIDGLRSPLFDERATPRLSRVRFRNEVLQKVIRLLSLTPEARRAKGGRGWGRGRISYAQLGINQLGAVYEGLLSYTGFFARETLYEVHRAGDKTTDSTAQAWFVPERDIVRYREDELLFDEGGQKRHRKYEPGTFIYRLAGRDRESSASYYTPEVLTRCLVKYALRELLQGKTANEILALSICEPAMGSGAFLVEAVDQLAEAYLDRRQEELKERVPPAAYALEKQRVKTYLAEARCYGVDLNPMAARLAGVSLWLATLHQKQRTPWFGARLAVGNSLVGARLEVWAEDDFASDEALAKAIAGAVKKAGDKGDLDGELARVLAAHEAKHAEAVAETRARIERAKRLAGAPEGDEEAEGDEAEASEADQAEAQRKEVVKALKKLVAELKLPRHHRRPPRKVEAQAAASGERPRGSVWHFLVPDAGMSPFETDKVATELAPEAVAKIKAWRKSVEEPWSARDIGRLQALSSRIDGLYRDHAVARAKVLAEVTPAPAVWGQAETARALPSIEDRERRLKALQGPGSAYERLRKVMDLWAALWAWPIEHAALLPSREGWLRALEEVLEVEGPGPVVMRGQISIWPKVEEDEGEAQPKKGAATLWSAAEEAVSKLRPLHWELVFSEVFVERGGFDLVVGNPPWLKVQWNERGLLEEFDPRIALDGVSASNATIQRKSILKTNALEREYLAEFSLLDGIKAFASSSAYYPTLTGLQTNLYKGFIVHGWRIATGGGTIALVHQDGIFDDSKGGLLRSEVYQRLRLALRFKNELMLFPDVGHARPYACTIMVSQPRQEIGFELISNLFHPATVSLSIEHDGQGAVPGIKNDADEFEARGHRRRMVSVGERELAMFARLFDRPNTPPVEARLPIVHSQEVISVLQKLAEYPRRLTDLGDAILSTEMWNETNAQKDGTIRRDTQCPIRLRDWIVSGPHIYVGNPLNKTPREVCTTKNAYDTIDAETIPDDYLPRTNFVPACSHHEYEARAPRFLGKTVLAHFRHVNRRMLAITGERTLIPAIIPPECGHTSLVFSVAFRDPVELTRWSGFLCSLPMDFLVRSKGKADLRQDTALSLPLPNDASSFASALSGRALRMNCLTLHYSKLWNTVWAQISCVGWSSADPRLSTWPSTTSRWQRACALRNAFERRWALVELDALAALELGLTIDELCTIYLTQFPVLREYEKGTYYDRCGRIAFTTNRGLTGVGLERKDFELWQSCLKDNKPLPKGFNTQGLEPPFEVRDREEDMRTAYAYFAKTLGKESAT
ncbi:MAG: N-6 DNA methylase [Minicystis sp.]